MSSVIELDRERTLRQLEETHVWLLIRQAALTGLLHMINQAERGIGPFDVERLQAAIDVAEKWRPIAGQIPKVTR